MFFTKSLLLILLSSTLIVLSRSEHYDDQGDEYDGDLEEDDYHNDEYDERDDYYPVEEEEEEEEEEEVERRDRECRRNWFDCYPNNPNIKKCISQNRRCDGTNHCPNGRDEQNCEMPLVGYFSQWEEAGECSRSCGEGMMRETRRCIRGRIFNACLGALSRLMPCNDGPCMEYSLPAGWSDWTVGECSVTCGDGIRKYTRTCQGEPCPGPTEANFRCSAAKCPETAKWGSWTIGKCSVSCGEGTRKDTRTCLQGDCSGNSIRNVKCVRSTCPVLTWGSWVLGECTVTCGGGTRTDKRTCLQRNCAGSDERKVVCNQQPCEVWSEWTIGRCSRTCGDGNRMDTRVCTSGECSGDSSRVVECNLKVCPVWSEWTIGRCSRTCGDGNRMDTRVCTSGECSGDSSRVVECNLAVCPEWGEWKEGTCSVTCETGVQIDTRECLRGKCDGEDTRTTYCSKPTCPIPAEYSHWMYGRCSKTCGEGVRIDMRFCIRGQCEGETTRNETCKITDCEQASWGRWVSGPCSVTCGNGKREYIRECVGGESCPGVSSTHVPCYNAKCEEKPTTSIYSPWMDWTQCTRSCGVGVQTKTRKCSGSKCVGADTKKRACFRGYCPTANYQWSECSRSCGWGTQIRTPTTTTSDYRDCKLRDCPKETCESPFYKRYGHRNSTCCDVTPLLSDDGVCGSSSLQTGVGNLIGRIVGGEKSAPKRFPWMAAIIINNVQWCGGVLIANEWILTAAHCVVYGTSTTVDVNTILIKFGTIDTTDTVETNFFVQTSGVKQIVHKDYDFPMNDIALLKLTKPPRYNAYVKPICLPEGEILPDDTNCVAAGWGKLSSLKANTNLMQEVQIRLLPDSMCSKAYGGNFKEDKMKCAGIIEGGKDTCQGDSGGPLMCQRCSSCQWITYGVVSFGDGCALKHKPGVYVKVNSYSDWIRSVTGMPKSDKKHEQCTSL